MTPYTLPEPHITEWSKRGWANNFYAKYPPHDADITISLFTTEMMDAAYQAGAASRDGEIEALRADALRYRWLRNHVIFGYPSSEGSSNKDAYLVVTGYGCKKSKKLTDQAIDAAIAAEATK